MSESRSLLRSAGAMSAATFVSRILGLAREQAQAYYFGAGFATDAFNAAFRIPNLLRDLFAEGAMSSAFVPTFTSVREKEGDDAAWRLASRTITVLAVILGVFTLLLLVGAPWILRVYTPGVAPDKLALAATMTRILSPFLLFVALAALAMGVLNTLRVFFLPALAPAWFNVACIAGMIVLPTVLVPAGLDPILSLAIGAMAGGILQFAVQLPAMRRRGFRFRWEFAPRDPGVVRIGSLMLPATFGLAATQINLLVDTSLASQFGDGPISWLQCAFRLIQLPIGLFGVAIATANLTRVSRDQARGDHEAMRRNLGGAIRAAALLTLPATAGLVALREPIIRVLFEHGKFDARATTATGAALLCYALGLHAYAVTKIQVPVFYALGETRVPVISSAISVGAKIAANFALIALLPHLGLDPFLALALTTSLAAWLNLGLLGWGSRRRLGSLAGLGVVATTLKMAVVSVVLGFAAAGTHAGLLAAWPATGLAAEIVRLAAASGVGVAIAVGGALALGVEEARALLARMRRRS
jgi:putative peptidoglycan lipid II flippase